MTEPQTRPLVDPKSKTQPVKQIYNGFEIEKRQVLMTKEEDYTKQKNALNLYNDVLQMGIIIDQGYIKDIQKAVEMLQELGISLNEFKPNTIRLRQFGPGFKKAKVSEHRYVLTLKDRKETKKREVEFKLSKDQFNKWWPETQGARVQKKRIWKTIKGQDFEIDAFTDRILLIAEQEVDNEADLARTLKLGMDVTNNNTWSNKCLAR